MSTERPGASPAASRLGRLLGWKPGALARNTALATFWQVVRLALQMAYLVLVARILGAEGYGYFAGIVAIAASLSPLAGAGFNLILVKQVSRDPAAFPIYWGRILVAILVSAPLLVGAMGVVAAVLLPGYSEASTVLLVAASELILVPIIAACSNAYQAHERLGASIFNFVFLNLVRLFAVAGLAVCGGKPDLTLFAVAYFAGTAVSAAVSLAAATRSFGRAVRDFRGMPGELWEGLGFSLSGVAGVAHGEIDKTLLLRMGGAATAGTYSVATRVISAAGVPLVAYVLAAAPRLFRAGEGGIAAGGRAARRLLLPVLAYGVCAGGGVFILAALLPRLLGADFVASVPIVRALAPLPMLIGVSNLLLAVLSCSGAQRVRVLLETIALGINVALNVALIPSFGAFGAVGAILVSQLALAGVAAATVFRISRRGILD